MAKRTQQPSSSAKADPVTTWAEAVLAGDVIAGPHVRNACRRHLKDLIEGPARGIYFDREAADRAIRFFPTVLRLNGGQFEGIPFELHPSQKFKTGSLFGWKRANGKRRYRRAYIEEGKGNGKSPWAAGTGHYCLVADGEPRAEVYAAAANKDQAMVLFRDAVAMRDQSPALRKRLKPSGTEPNVWNLADLRTGSFFRPISREKRKAGSGPRPHCALCDEVHEHPDRLIIDMLERGFKFREQPLLAMITNSGSDRNSVAWEERTHAVRVAAGTMTPDENFTFVGEVIDDDTFAFVCALDKDDDPLEDPSCWPKANPLFRITIREDYLAGVVRQAKQMPGKRNGILRLHFCQWTDAETAWIARETLEAALADFDPVVEHRDRDVHAGVDLSESQDLTAAAFAVQTGQVERQDEDGRAVLLPTFDAWIEAWTPKDTIRARAERDQAPYETWAEQGFLHAIPGKQIRLDFVAARLAGIGAELRLKELAYLPDLTWDSRRVLAGVRLAREAIGLAMAAEQTHADFHKNGARTSGVISVENSLSPERYLQLKEWMEQTLSAGNTFKPLLLDNGAKYTSMGMTGEDAQHIELRKHQIEEICRAFDVFPQMVGHAGDQTPTFASAEQFFIAHVVHTLTPWYEDIEQSIDLMLEDEGEEGVFAKFNQRGLLRGAMKDEAEYFSRALGNGGSPPWLTQNEVRELQDRNPLPGGDELRNPVATTAPAPSEDPDETV
ncbi:MAG: phage portal protein [Rhizobiales bacterium]|nr:phage portal protein [Hyphomicrobiales bacterium]